MGSVSGVDGCSGGKPPDCAAASPASARVVVDGNGADVHLAHFCDIDPPLDAAAAAGGEFIDLTAARGLPRVELELLRLAYEHVLG